MLKNSFFTILIAFFLFSSLATVEAAGLKVPKPGDRDKCPVCGMFVAKYKDWVATIVYKDGHAHFFDGAKDMFKMILDMSKYSQDHKLEDISNIVVSEYYGLEQVDARKALYVIGSDVTGPMGHELVPLKTKEDAEEFKKDHKGVRILTFNEITISLLKKLDKGKFE